MARKTISYSDAFAYANGALWVVHTTTKGGWTNWDENAVSPVVASGVISNGSGTGPWTMGNPFLVRNIDYTQPFTYTATFKVDPTQNTTTDSMDLFAFGDGVYFFTAAVLRQLVDAGSGNIVIEGVSVNSSVDLKSSPIPCTVNTVHTAACTFSGAAGGYICTIAIDGITALTFAYANATTIKLVPPILAVEFASENTTCHVHLTGVSGSYSTMPFVSFINDPMAYSAGNLVGQGNWAAGALSAVSPKVAPGYYYDDGDGGGDNAVDTADMVAFNVSKNYEASFLWTKVNGNAVGSTEAQQIVIGDENNYLIGSLDVGSGQASGANTAQMLLQDSGTSNPHMAVFTCAFSTSHTVTLTKMHVVNEGTALDFTGVILDNTVTVSGEDMNVSAITVKEAQVFMLGSGVPNMHATNVQVGNYVDNLDTISAAKSGGNVIVTFTYAGAASFKVSKDGGAFATQTSPFTDTGAASAAHTYVVQAYNAGGNVLAAAATGGVSANSASNLLVVVL